MKESDVKLKDQPSDKMTRQAQGEMIWFCIYLCSYCHHQTVALTFELHFLYM